eukprot:TRINITY_DN319_c0_g1_i3.p1 TRINITY_DN319_c0_g1~~TRINITY_DN319_c0_g1_i3.p1  ORF type:complete len:529 (+),score=232.00 TRINITY_DN319_c0_g1_i3:143-1729(+)
MARKAKRRDEEEEEEEEETPKVGVKKTGNAISKEKAKKGDKDDEKESGGKKKRDGLKPTKTMAETMRDAEEYLKRVGNPEDDDEDEDDEEEEPKPKKKAAKKGKAKLKRVGTMAQTMRDAEEYLKRVGNPEDDDEDEDDEEEEPKPKKKAAKKGKAKLKRVGTMAQTMKEGKEYLKRMGGVDEEDEDEDDDEEEEKKPTKKGAKKKGAKKGTKKVAEEKERSRSREKEKKKEKAAPKKKAEKPAPAPAPAAPVPARAAPEPKKPALERRKTADNKDLCNFACSGPAHPEPQWCDKLLGHDGEHFIDCECVRGLVADKVDVVFCIDATGSMGSYIEASKTAIKTLVKEFSDRSKHPQFGIVAYRDHSENMTTSFLTKVCDLTTPDNALKFLNELAAWGGGDFPEAVFDGLVDSVDKINWRNNVLENVIRILVHICDAPPHGKEFGASGSHPEGCPCKKTTKEVADKLNHARIRYKLVKCTDSVSQMAKIFKENFIFFDSKDLKSAKELVAGVWDMVAREISPMDRIKAH